MSSAPQLREQIPRGFTVRLSPPCAFLNSNQRPHYRVRAELTKGWREATRTLARRSGVSYGTKPVRIVVSIRWPNNIKRDPGNWYPTAKACVDGLVDAGVLRDDDAAHVIGPDMRREYPNGPARVTVTITPFDPDEESQ